MAARLTVIFSQSTAGHAELEETLLAELMMTAGLDVTLVGSLTRVQFDSTDHLCLSSLGQNLALVTELPVELAAQHWKRLGLMGELIPWGAGQLTNERRIYHLPLPQGVRPIVAQLKQILSDKQVRTVNVIFPKAPRPSTPAVVQSPPAPSHSAPSHSAQARSAESQSGESTSVGSSSAESSSLVSRVGGQSSRAAQPSAPGLVNNGPFDAPTFSRQQSLPKTEPAKQSMEDDELEFAELDKLVDDLDALDL